MNCRTLCRLSRVTSNKIFQLNHFEKCHQRPVLLLNRRYIQQTTDMRNMHQYPDTDSTHDAENNSIRDNTKSSMRDAENNFNKNAQNLKNVKDNYGNQKSDAGDAYENTKQNVKDTYHNLKSNAKDTYENTKENVKDKAKMKFENTKENVNENYQNAKDKIKDSYNQFKDNYDNEFSTAKKNVKEGAQNLKQNLKEGKQNLKEGIQNAKQSAEETFEDTREDMKDKYDKTKKKFQDKSNEKKEEGKSTMENMKEKTKGAFETIKNELTGNLEMNDMLYQARMNFENLLKMEDSIQKNILKDAKAIIFLSIMKSGLGVSGVIGSGVMITRMQENDQEWSGPIAVGLTGVSIGLNAGFEKADNIIIIRDEKTLKQLSFQRELQLSGDIEYVMGKTGYTSTFPLTTKEHENIPMIAYSMTKGAYVSLSLKGEMIKIKNDCNEEFYKKKINVDDIILQKIDVPQNKEYSNLIKLVNNYYDSSDKNKTSTTKQAKKNKSM